MSNTFLLVLSPHLDDAIFSVCGYLLETKHRTKIVTVCAGIPDNNDLSSWDKRCGFTSGQLAAISRREEDFLACSKVGADYEHLNFTDFPYSNIKNNSSISNEITKRLPNIQEIWIPLGIGMHPDHITVRDSALEILNTKKINIVFYADVPYSNAYKWSTPDSERKENFKWKPVIEEIKKKGFILDKPEIKILKKREIETKLAIASLYKSQIKQLKNHYPNLMEFGGELATEVIWRLR